MEDETPPLFDLSEFPVEDKKILFKELGAPVWTENKAQLINRYLRYFVFITKHGTYLDAFAGAQESDHPNSWAARLVLESEPKRLRTVVLFEKDKSKCDRMRELCAQHHADKSPRRTVLFHKGDMNVELPKYLAANPIKPKEATFCLLDQRTFECDWATVETLSRHKKEGHKIELFYFLAQGWLDRAVAALGNKEQTLRRWWGNDDWKRLLDAHSFTRGKMLSDRFKQELGYSYSYGFPIFERDDKGGRVMFWMVHASDHPEAPKLMLRSYRNAIAPLEPMEQLEWEISEHTQGDESLLTPVWNPVR